MLEESELDMKVFEFLSDVNQETKRIEVTSANSRKA